VAFPGCSYTTSGDNVPTFAVKPQGKNAGNRQVSAGRRALRQGRNPSCTWEFRRDDGARGMILTPWARDSKPGFGAIGAVGVPKLGFEDFRFRARTDHLHGYDEEEDEQPY